VGVYDWDAQYIEDYIASVEGKGKEIMPCGDTQCGDWERLENIELRKELLRVTRVACELASVIRLADSRVCHTYLFTQLSLSTQKWVREHEEVDKKRRK